MKAHVPGGRLRQGIVFLVLYISCVPFANWLVGHVGRCSIGNPCVVPVWFDIVAPSGVLAIGAALVLRDLVQRRLGLKLSLIAILVGSAISFMISPADLVLASVASFTISEGADTLVFAPLQRRGLTLAVAASGLVGAIVDSTIFLMLAFGNLDFLTGQILGKIWAITLALPFIHFVRASEPKSLAEVP